MSVLGSVTFPVTAAAAATNGLASIVLAPGPCLPSKFLLEVLTAYFPAGILSSFIAKHAEHPGCLSANPALVIVSRIPSSIICSSTTCEPGTNQTVTSSAFFLPFIIEANAQKSSILPLVKLPTKSKSTFLPIIASFSA